MKPKKAVKSTTKRKSPAVTEKASKHKRSKRVDPNAAREKTRYKRPIASRELILTVLADQRQPAPFWMLAEALGLHAPEDLEALDRRLRAMLRDGQLITNRERKYLVAEQGALQSGRVIGHADGFGFFCPDDGGDDAFLSPKEMRRVFNQDRVMVSIIGVDRRGRPEAVIVEILERAHEKLVGRLQEVRGAFWLLPEDRRISQQVLVPAADLGGAVGQDMVVVELVDMPERERPAVGRVIEVLGQHLQPGMEIDVALVKYALPHEWSDGVLAEAAKFGARVRAKDKHDRLDLRELPFVTIDGEDARDFDDAVFCKPTAQGWRLFVAIADVAHYVRPQTELDTQAYARGTSVYFPRQVIPMLPETLSNGLCSLNPKVDRLVLLCEMLINRDGEMVRSRFANALIRSHARLTYTQVGLALQQKDAQTIAELGALNAPLNALYDLYGALRGARDLRGAMDFDIPEPVIIFDAQRKIERISVTERNDAHKLIEECMIAANVAAARFILRHRFPALLRIHEGANPRRLEDLREFLALRGLSLGGGDQPTAQDYAQLARQLPGRNDADLVQTMLLRSLNQARYGIDELGHFGLGLAHYAHFTSPIRRYPDLMIHRTIKHILAKGRRRDFAFTDEAMVRIGEDCSQAERRADEAVRDVVDWLKCEFMLHRVGGVFPAVVSSVLPFGAFVTLDELYVDGLIHVSSLPGDYYQHDSARGALVGRHSGRTLAMGDKIEVRVTAVHLDERRIDLELLSPTPGKTAKKGAKKASAPAPTSTSRKKTTKTSRRKRG